MARYFLFRLATATLGRLPGGFLSILGAFAGILGYVLARNARKRVLRNLAIARPDWTERQRRTAAVEVFVHGAWGHLELFMLPHASPTRLVSGYSVDHLDVLDGAIAEGRGVIMVSAHVGALAVAAQFANIRGTPVNVLVEQLQPQALHDFVAGLRGAHGMRMIAVGPGAARQVIEALRRGELVGIMSDRDVAGTGDMFPFFGVETRITTAPATLARRTGANVVPCVAYRSGLLRGKGDLFGPVEIPHTTSPAADIREGTLQIISYLELFIHEHPQQWAVFEDIWPSGTIPTANTSRAVM